MTSQLCKCRSSPGSLCPRRGRQRVLPGGPLLTLPPSPRVDRSYQKAEERRPDSPETRACPGQRQQRRPRSRTRAPAPTRARRLSIPPNSGVRHPSGREDSLSLIGFHQRYRIKKKRKGLHHHHHRQQRPNPPLLAFLRPGRPCDPPRLLLPPLLLQSRALPFLLPRLKLQLLGWEGYGLPRAGSCGHTLICK